MKIKAIPKIMFNMKKDIWHQVYKEKEQLECLQTAGKNLK